MGYFLQCAYDLGWLVLGAMLLIAVLRSVGGLLRYVWLPEAVRDAVERGGPLVGAVTVLAYLAFGFLVIFEREEHFAWVILGTTLLFAAFAWSPLYDLISGVAFRASRVCRVGDHIKVGDVEGRVVRVGTRVLVVRARSGDEAVLYYGRIVSDAFRRTQSLVGAHVHSFLVDAPPPDALADFRKEIGAVAMRCHWSSVVHAPRFEIAEDGKLEISVYALHRDYAPLVEAAVRKGIAARTARAAGGGSGPLLPKLPGAAGARTTRGLGALAAAMAKPPTPSGG